MADTIIVPRRREDFFDENGDPTHRFIRWVEAVTGQTNNTSVIVETTEQELTSTGSRVSRNAARINSLELKEFELVETAVALTTNPFEVIDCINTGLIEVTLDPQAIGKDEVHIARSGATVDIIGVVNGKTNVRLNVKGFSIHLIKQITGTGWLQI